MESHSGIIFSEITSNHIIIFWNIISNNKDIFTKIISKEGFRAGLGGLGGGNAKAESPSCLQAAR